MANYNGMGPNNEGPQTGRGVGPCNPANGTPSIPAAPFLPRPYGIGRGQGGLGRGRGLGFGRGFRRRVINP